MPILHSRLKLGYRFLDENIASAIAAITEDISTAKQVALDSLAPVARPVYGKDAKDPGVRLN